MVQARRLVFVSIVSLHVLRAAAGWAQPSNGANALIERGLQARTEHRDADALDWFLQAYQVEPSPRVLAQVALAEQALGRWIDAEKHLILATNAADDPWIDLHRPTLLKALEVIRDKLATVEVRCDRQRAELWLNGSAVGSLPLPAQRVAAGSVLIEVRADGFNAFRQIVVLEPRQSLLMQPDLLATGARAAPTPFGPSYERDVGGGHAHAATRRTLAWTMLAVGGTLLAGAIAAHVTREISLSYYNDDSRCFYGSLSREQRCGRALGQADVAGVVAIAGYAGAAAALGTSGYFFFTVVDRTPTQNASQARWEAGAAVGHSF